MKRNEFYEALNSLPKCYNWKMMGKTLTAIKTRGVAQGITFNPITAVAMRKGLGVYLNNKKDTVRAGRRLGLPIAFINSVYDSTKAVSNRGNTQVIRGRILSRLGV